MVDEPGTDQTKAFYDRISTAYDLIADAGEHAARDRGIDLLAAVPGEDVLVIGFGTGHAVVALARAVSSAGRVCGVDISDGMLAVARKRMVAERVTERVELCVGDARHLPYGDGEFDAVFIAFTLELFDDEDIPRVLAEIRRALRPRGRVGIVAMSDERPQTFMTDLYVWMHRHFPHWVDCRPIPLAAWLQRSGFGVERLERLSIWGLAVAIAVVKQTS